jgi:two-component system chemotaxis response regulator CheB
MRVAAELPPDLPAAVCVVIHLPSRHQTALAEILQRISGHDVALATDDERLRDGILRIAPPDRHLVVDDDRLRVILGPRENRARPAVDPLFRTAARAYGRRLISVVLSGALDDGTAGTQAVHLRGGTTIAHDPAEAPFADMPANAIATGVIDHVVRAAEIAPLICRLVADLTAAPPTGCRDDATPAAAVMGSEQRFSSPPDVDARQEASPGEAARATLLDPPDEPSPDGCPDDGGMPWIVPGSAEHLRCRVGDRSRQETLDEQQEAVIGDAVWTGLRAPDEQASRHDRVTDPAEDRGERGTASRFAVWRDEAVGRASRIREALHPVTPRIRPSPSTSTVDT